MQHEHFCNEAKTEQNIIDNIKKYGCHIVLIEANDYLPSFAYSIGLFENYGHAEIICFGLPLELLKALINDAHDLIKTGEKITPNKEYSDFLEDYSINFLEVKKEHYKDYLGYAHWFNKSWNFPVLQLVWPDKKNNFPWSEEFNQDWRFKQPLLDRNIDFKFYEERNLGVFTTRQVLEGQPILNVYHNEDGDWQFMSDPEPDINDAKLVSLEEITKLDPSVNDIYYLPYAWCAWRDSQQEDWVTEKLQKE